MYLYKLEYDLPSKANFNELVEVFQPPVTRDAAASSSGSLERQ